MSWFMYLVYGGFALFTVGFGYASVRTLVDDALERRRAAAAVTSARPRGSN